MPVDDPDMRGAELVAQLGLTSLLERCGAVVQHDAEHGVTLRVPVGSSTVQPYGFLHGGVSAALAQAAALLATQWHAAPAATATCIELHANHLRPVRDGVITLHVRPVRRGRTLAIWDCELLDAQLRTVSVARCSVAVSQPS
jgi:uncharacterized protein (TIGR00369 family)